jgi:hypothetical protein
MYFVCHEARFVCTGTSICKKPKAHGSYIRERLNPNLSAEVYEYMEYLANCAGGRSSEVVRLVSNRPEVNHA